MKKSLLTLLLGLALAGSLLAQPGRQRSTGLGMGTGRGGRMMMRNERMQAYLNLTDEQREKIDALRVQHLKEVKPYNNKLAELSVKLNTLSTADKMDSKAVDSVIDEIGGLRTKLMKLQEAHWQQIRALLTDEQRVIFDSRPLGRGGRGGRGFRPGIGRGRGMNRPDAPGMGLGRNR